jgi:pimeloyl-ACP methyl ester carboxylesterase
VLPLVLLPGMNCTADLWTGCGLDEALTPTLDEQSIDAQVDRLLAELPRVFVLGGLSLGAIVAMALVARAPERVDRLCLVSTNAKAPTSEQRVSWQRWIDRLDAGESARSLQADILGALLSPAAAQDRPDLVARTLAMAEATGRESLRAQLNMQSTRVDLRPALRRVTVPTLLISGARDTICPPEFHMEIAAQLPAARVVTIDGGHLLPLERADAFGALVRAWCDPTPT